MSIITRTANLRDLLESLFGWSSPVERRAFSSETSIFLFAEAGVTPVGELSTSLCLHSYFISNSIIFYKSDIISSRWHPWWELIDVENFIHVIMTTNKEIFTSIGVLSSSLSDHEQNLLMSLLGATKTVTLQNSLRIFNSLLFTW